MNEIDTALKIVRLSKRFDGVTVLNNVSISVAAGERLGVIGANGSGKSTLLRLIGGWIPQDLGNIEILGRTVNNLGSYERYALGMRELSQFPLIDSELTGADVIAIARIAPRMVQGNWLRKPQAPVATLPSFLNELLLGIDVESQIKDLSLAARKMIAITAALASSPRLLLLDEPTAGLDQAQMTLFERALQAARDCTVVVVEHNLNFLHASCGRIIEICEGAICDS